MEQRSDDWFGARLGRVTASKVKDVMANVVAQTVGRRRMAVDLHWAEHSRGSWSQPEGSPPGSSITVGVSASFQPSARFFQRVSFPSSILLSTMDVVTRS